jgi:hypothetical protein
MRWVVVLFLVLLSIPVAQVAADAWYGRPGPELLMVPANGAAAEEDASRGAHSNFAPARHSRYRLYESFAPLFPPHTKTSAKTTAS